MASRMRNVWYITEATRRYHRDGELEIDETAKVSRNTVRGYDHGAYVQAWVWIEDPEPTQRRPQ
jgi:hypothetical protein